MLTFSLLCLLSLATAQQFISVEWDADRQATRNARYDRNVQDPGTGCHPSPCGENTKCMVNNQGNPICSCVRGYVPMPNPIDGCVPPSRFPRSPVILQNRLGGGHVSQSRREPPGDVCNPTPCGPGTTCTPNRDGNPECRCQPGYSPNPDTITGCKPECTVDPDCRMGYLCQSYRCVKKPDPCDPNPCGPGARCSVNHAGNAICQCEPGLIPKPDTITGCGPECTIDPDCQSGYVCQNQRCVVKPDPCDPSPCGPGARCSITRNGNAICRCEPGLIPKPDTITGCGPECVVDPDCQRGFICETGRCVEKPDPCDPSPCGPGARCSVTNNGNAICRCEPGLIPKPDTITGCGPECTIDPDCQSGYICQAQRCVVKPDPCDPSPCGPGAVCTVTFNGNSICRCEPGLIPKPDTITGCGPECVVDPDCQQGFVCRNTKCVVKPDPCDPTPCGPNTFCTNVNGNPICKCNAGFIPKPDTITGCGRECERDPDCRGGFICRNYRCVEKPDPCNPSPCGPNTKCMVNRLGNPICRCLPNFVPKPDTITGCGRECERDPDCQSGYICSNYQCVEKPDPCDPSPCGPNTECTVTRTGNPLCRCLPNYIPKPDTITGCGRECERDPDCNSGNICSNYRCIPRPDPCDPSPCGPNTNCNVNRNGNPTCTCIDGFAPQPDTITGCAKIEVRTAPPDPCDPSPCGPNTRCEINRLGNPVCKCLQGYSPNPDTITGCKEIDPCDPNPCGPNAECFPQGQQAVCKCPSGYQGDPYRFCRRGECSSDPECPQSKACNNYYCTDPCIGNCGENANCEVRNHRPICSCPEGYNGDPLAACDRNLVIGGRYNPTPREEPREFVVIGQQYSGEPVQQDRPGRSGGGGKVVIGQQYKPDLDEPASRHIVGSRYKQGGSSQPSGGVISARGGGSSARGGGRSSSRQVVVVGSTKRRRRALQYFLKSVL